MIIKKCEICGREYEVGDHREKTSKYCSYKCNGKGTAIRNNRRWLEKNKDKIKQFGEEYVRKSYQRNYKRKISKTERGNLITRRANIISRCCNENDSSYNRYGGRGIKICNKWRKSFEEFYEWAINNGYKKELQLDRIDNNGNYEPDNCRWVTPQKNSRNRRDNVTDFVKNKRICGICKENKDITSFGKDKNMPLGRRYYCRNCENEYVKKRRIIRKRRYNPYLETLK